MGKELQIRNSTVDFLIFTKDAGEDGIEVRVQDNNVWLTQNGIAKLFDIDRSVVAKHLSNIYVEKEVSDCALLDVQKFLNRHFLGVCVGFIDSAQIYNFLHKKYCTENDCHHLPHNFDAYILGALVEQVFRIFVCISPLPML